MTTMVIDCSGDPKRFQSVSDKKFSKKVCSVKLFVLKRKLSFDNLAGGLESNSEIFSLTV